MGESSNRTGRRPSKLNNKSSNLFSPSSSCDRLIANESSILTYPRPVSGLPSVRVGSVAAGDLPALHWVCKEEHA